MLTTWGVPRRDERRFGRGEATILNALTAPRSNLPASTRFYRFGTAEVDVTSAVLRVEGKEVALRPQVFDLLVHLLRNRDRIVPREELMGHLWPNLAVSRDALARAVWTLRQALGEEEGSPVSWIRTFSKRGYRFVGDVGEAEEAIETRSEAVVELVGRAAELERIVAAMAAVAAGRGRTCLVRGEPGIGKTTLLEASLGRAASLGFLVLRANAHDVEGLSPFWQWVQIVRGFCEAVTPEERDAALAGSVSDLLRIAPELAPELGGPSTALMPRDVAETQVDRSRAFAAVLAFLHRAASIRPLALGFDDVQWCDAGSLRLLSVLVRELADESIFVLATLREGALAEGELKEMLGHVARAPRSSEIVLRGLSNEAVRQLVERQLRRPISPSLAEEIHGRTGGNPFFAEEIARLLARPSAQGSTELALDTIPSRVRDAVLQRIDRLDPEAKALLATAAVIGSSFEIGTLRRVTSIPFERILGLLDLSIGERLVEEDAEPGTFRFAHGLIRETCAHALPRVERMRLHLALGALYEARVLDEGAATIEEISRHYYEAAAFGAFEPAIAYARKAGDRARSRLAFEDAALHFGRAVALLERHGPERFEARCELSLSLGELARVRGAPAEEIKRRFRQAMELAERAGSPLLLARATLGYSNHGGAADPYSSPAWLRERATLLERAVAALGGADPALESRLLAHLAGALVEPSDAEKRLHTSERALALAESTADAPTIAQALVEHAMVLLDRAEDLDLRETAIRRALRLARDSRAVLVEIEAQVILAGVLLERGDLAGGDVAMNAVRELSQGIGRPLESLRALLWDGMRMALRGEWESAEAMLSRFQREGAHAFVGVDETARIQWGKICGLRGRSHELASMLDWLRLPRSHLSSAWRSTAALVLASTGAEREATAEVDDLLRDGISAIPRDGGWLSTIANLGEVSVRRGDRRLARELYEVALPHAGRCIGIGQTVFCDGAVDRLLGRLAGALGDLASAELHFAAAEAIHARLDAPTLDVWTTAQRARALLDAGRKKDASALRRDAERKAEELGMEGAIALTFGY